MNAPVSGILKEIMKKEGDTVTVGEGFYVIDTDGVDCTFIYTMY